MDEDDTTSEEYVIQQLENWLIQLGYQPNQIQTSPQYRVKRSIHWRDDITYPVDLAVFRGEERRNEDLILIAECKSGSRRGLDQLKKYLQCTDCPLGIWYDGQDMAVLHHIRDALSGVVSNPPKDFAVLIKKRREQLDEDYKADKPLKGTNVNIYSIRTVAKKAGIQPTYLSKIERKEVGPPSAHIVKSLATVLQIDVNAALISAGYMPEDLHNLLMVRPDIASKLIEAMKENPKKAISELVVRRKIVRTGEW